MLPLWPVNGHESWKEVMPGEGFTARVRQNKADKNKGMTGEPLGAKAERYKT